MRYLIRQVRHYFAGSTPAYPFKVIYLGSDGMPTHTPFENRAEAMAALRKMEAEQIVLTSCESRRPTLSVVPETQWPSYVK